jgi:hypothetical protein
MDATLRDPALIVEGEVSNLGHGLQAYTQEYGLSSVTCATAQRISRGQNGARAKRLLVAAAIEAGLDLLLAQRFLVLLHLRIPLFLGLTDTARSQPGAGGGRHRFADDLVAIIRIGCGGGAIGKARAGSKQSNTQNSGRQTQLQHNIDPDYMPMDISKNLGAVQDNYKL